MKKITKKAPAPSVASVKTVKSVKSKAPAKKTAAPAKKQPAATSEPPATFISAQIDIGFGNHLYVRGTGPGLSWDRGVAMDCVGNGLWTTCVKNASATVTFKVLVNDLTWSTGPDFVVQSGQSITITPTF